MKKAFAYPVPMAIKNNYYEFARNGGQEWFKGGVSKGEQISYLFNLWSLHDHLMVNLSIIIWETAHAY